MKYAIIDAKMGSIWTEKFDTKEEALKKAEREWNGLSKADRKLRDEYRVVGYKNEENFDDFLEINEVVKEYK